MSLINVKNLIAPLHNKVHLFTIILLAMLVGVARLDGASLSIERRGGSDLVPGPTSAEEAEFNAMLERSTSAGPKLSIREEVNKLNGGLGSSTVTTSTRKEPDRVVLPKRLSPPANRRAASGTKSIDRLIQKGSADNSEAARRRAREQAQKKKNDSAGGLDEIEAIMGLR